MRTEVLVKGPKGPMVFEEDIEGLATLPPSRVVVYAEEGEPLPSLPSHHRYTVVRLGGSSPRRPLRLRVWRGQGGEVPPAPYVVRGRPWEGAVKFIAQAIRLGRIPPTLWVVGWKAAQEAARALKGLGRAIIREVLKGTDLPVRGERVKVPGWAFPALDGLGGEAARERQKAFEAWCASLAASRGEVGEEWAEERPRSREDWAHDTGRPAPSWAHALLRAWEELKGEGLPLPPLTVRVFARTLVQLLTGLEMEPGAPKGEPFKALVERAGRLVRGGYFPPTPKGLGVSPEHFEALLRAAGRPWRVGALAGYWRLPLQEARMALGENRAVLEKYRLLAKAGKRLISNRTRDLLTRALREALRRGAEVVCFRRFEPEAQARGRTGTGEVEVFSLPEMEAAIRLFLEYRVETRALQGVLQVLEDLNLEWPKYPGEVPGGISPLFWLIYWAREERRWGSLAERLGTWNKRALRLARDLQEAVAPGATLEAAAKELGAPLEEARNIWALLQQGSLEEWMKAQTEAEADEAEGAEPSRLRTYEEILVEEDRRRQAECLQLALEAKGVTAEEALADPALLAEVARLARAFYGEEEEQENPPPGGEAGGAGQANPSL